MAEAAKTVPTRASVEAFLRKVPGEERRRDCEVLVDRTYFLPLGDRSWPDDTRVEFEYMDDPT